MPGATPSQKKTLTIAPALLHSIAKLTPADKGPAPKPAAAAQKLPTDDPKRRGNTTIHMTTCGNAADAGQHGPTAETPAGSIRKRVADDAACSGDEGPAQPGSSRQAKRSKSSRSALPLGTACREQAACGQVTGSQQPARLHHPPWRMQCEHQRYKLLEKLPCWRPPPPTCNTPRQPLRPCRDVAVPLSK